MRTSVLYENGTFVGEEKKAGSPSIVRSTFNVDLVVALREKIPIRWNGIFFLFFVFKHFFLAIYIGFIGFVAH